jgi:hypothetical protein
MGAVDQNRAVTVLGAMLAQNTAGATAGINVRLGTTAPTGSAAMTQLTGTGYTAGGTACTFATPTTSGGGAVASNTTVLSWTNGSGSSWSVVGIELWDQAGTPLRWMYGTWTGQPVVIANGNAFQVSAGAIVPSQT